MTKADCLALLEELRLTPSQASVGTTSDGFLVLIYKKTRRPLVVHFRGHPVKYLIGGGMPKAL